MAREIPVVDGDDGADTLGCAATPQAATRIASACFPCRHVELTSDDVTIADGSQLLGEKWIAYQIGSPAELHYLRSDA